MTAGLRTGSIDIRSLAAVISMIAVVGLSFGLTLPLVSIILEGRGVPGSVIGANSAMPALALLLFTPLVPRVIARAGVRTTLAVSLAIVAGSIVSLKLFDTLAAWFVIRFVMGMAEASLFAISEAWINELAPNARRGSIMGIYTAILAGAFALGALLLSVTGTDGWTPFVAGAVICSAAGLPLAGIRARSLALEGKPAGGVVFYIRTAPVATAAAIVYGAIETGTFALLPPYGLRNGFDAAGAAQLLAVVAVGSVVLQPPIGWLADRMERTRLLMICAGAGVIGGATLPLVIAWPVVLWPSLFVWGGVVAGLYTVGLTLLGERFRGPDLVGANAAFVMLYGLGALVGPPLSGSAMDIWNPHGFAAALAVVCLAYLVLAAVRQRQRRRA